MLKTAREPLVLLSTPWTLGSPLPSTIRTRHPRLRFDLTQCTMNREMNNEKVVTKKELTFEMGTPNSAMTTLTMSKEMVGPMRKQCLTTSGGMAALLSVVPTWHSVVMLTVEKILFKTMVRSPLEITLKSGAIQTKMGRRQSLTTNPPMAP